MSCVLLYSYNLDLHPFVRILHDVYNYQIQAISGYGRFVPFKLVQLTMFSHGSGVQFSLNVFRKYFEEKSETFPKFFTGFVVQ